MGFDHLYGVILAGGSGTRLWPLSRRDHPKQFLTVGSGGSLIQQTFARLRNLIPSDQVFVICGSIHAPSVLKSLGEIKPDQVWVEPEARNTAPALALAAILLHHRDPEALMVVLPADHLILESGRDQFVEDVKLAAQVAQEENALVTLGIRPDYAATGFGYLEQGEERRLNFGSYFSVKAFHEKPDEATATGYLRSGKYFWNSGMFVWQAATFLRELERCQPKMFSLFQDLASEIEGKQFSKKLKKVFAEVEGISVDYAVMEKAEQVLMVPAGFPWDDVGSLTALEKVLSPDGDGNRSSGDFFGWEARNNLILSKSRPVAMIGVQDLLVVESEGALLVLPKDRAQDVKKIVELLKKQGREDLL